MGKAKPRRVVEKSKVGAGIEFEKAVTQLIHQGLLYEIVGHTIPPPDGKSAWHDFSDRPYLYLTYRGWLLARCKKHRVRA
jgi:hypothetical protein